VVPAAATKKITHTANRNRGCRLYFYDSANGRSILDIQVTPRNVTRAGITWDWLENWHVRSYYAR